MGRMSETKMTYNRESYLLFAVWLAIGIGFLLAGRTTAGIIAGVFFTFALCCTIQQLLRSRSEERAQGVVIDHREEEEYFFPVIEFTDARGSLRREATELGRGVKSPAVGRRVVIRYDPMGNRGCEIDVLWRRYLLPIAFALIGAVFALGAIFGEHTAKRLSQ